MTDEKRPPKNTEEVIEFFLGSVVMQIPKELPTQQYKQREIAAEVRGYNKAQEDLRDFLAQIEGKTKAAERGRSLATSRHKNQMRSHRMGGMRLWMG